MVQLVMNEKIKPLDYETVLSLKEVKERFNEITSAFKEVRGNYPEYDPNQMYEIMKDKISQEDCELLNECIGVLLPLGMQSEVQKELAQCSSENYEETMFAQIGKMQADIMMYLAEFNNSSVTRI